MVPTSRQHSKTFRTPLDLTRCAHASTDQVDLWQLHENLRTRPSDMRFPIGIVFILVWIDNGLIALCHFFGRSYSAASVCRFGLGRAAKECDVKAKELHQPQLCQARLIT